ncbi:MAG: T9SS type A sorting domain-containing protein [Candidatus Marinimicrobia bacterium]|nr:T9SS type A sorting domain-containing protein [Candidatus Neomarinimicrobiota bacterium]
MKRIVKLISFGLMVISLSRAVEISYDLRANIFQATVYSATDTNWTNIDVYYITNPDGWQEPNQSWGSFDRRSTSSGGVQKNSIFAHPDYEGQVSATVAEYTINQSISISSYYGLADGQVYNYGSVRFIVQIKEGNTYSTILDSLVEDSDYWRYFEYDLIPWYDSEITLRMITDPYGWTAEDWAHWSESIVVIDHTTTTVYVSQSGNDSTGNGSVEYPYASIQWGIEMAYATDTLIIDDGTYFENLYIYGKDLTISSTNGPEHCIIDGSQLDRVIEIENCNLSLSGFSIVNGNTDRSGGGMSVETSNIEIDNCVFANNQATNSDWGSGGGLQYRQLDSTATYNVVITNCIFDNNIANGSAGGANFQTGYEDSSGLVITIENCAFINNMADSRGGIRIDGLNTNFQINNCDFTGNQVNRHTSALWLGSDITGIISNSSFFENISSLGIDEYNKNGAVMVVNANVDFINCTFADNDADLASGLNIGGGGIATLTNSIFWGNFPEPINVVSWEGVAGVLTVNFSDVQDGIDSIYVDSLAILNWGEGNIDANPLFCNPDSGDYTIAENSPCAGTGENGENIGAADIGCGPMSIFNGNSTIPNKFTLYQNFPNPFNPITQISYQIPELSFVNLSIFNINGKLVSTLVNEQVQAGNYSVKWDAEDFSSGVYFYKIVAGKYTETGKAILLK